MKALIWVLACAAASLAGPAAATSPRQHTLAELLGAPERYRDRFVRVRGQVDNCIGSSCNLCPEEMTQTSFDRTRCLAVRFHGEEGELPESRAAWLVQAAHRFATITVDAWFDPSCLPGVKPELDCTGALGLREARIVSVHSRKTAREGLVSWASIGDLVPAPESEQAAMLAAYESAGFDGSESSAFLVKPTGWLFEKRTVGLVCACLEQSCRDRWPTRYFGGLDSPANPFLCRFMTKGPGGWAYGASPDDVDFSPR